MKAKARVIHYLPLPVLLLALLLLRGTGLFSDALNNEGMLLLNRILATGNPAPFSHQAESSFKTAINLVRDNRSAWRGLGFLLEAEERPDEAWSAWQAAASMGDEFIQWGHRAKAAGGYEEALVWYERATRMEPTWGDPWYYRGLVLQQQQSWDSMLEAFETASQLESFHTAGHSELYFTWGFFYQNTPGYQELDKALQMYDKALSVNDFSSVTVYAETFYNRGVIYSWQQRDPLESVAEFEQALALLPSHHWARLRLGYALYQAHKDVQSAETEIKRAITDWPESSIYRKWPYRYLGDIYRDAGLTAKAITAYEEVLRLDQNDGEVQDILAALKE